MYKWLILTSLLCTVANGQTAYTWVDESGQTHYSDRPFPGAAEIELSGAQGFSAPAAPPPVRATAEEVDPAAAYNAFNIVRPLHQETLWNIAGIVDVSLEIGPLLRSGHRVGVYLDGVLTDVTSTRSELQLSDVFRGQHNLQAVILDNNGNDVLRSSVVTFMVQQTTLLNPNNPNAR
jgi:hypothetical protein